MATGIENIGMLSSPVAQANADTIENYLIALVSALHPLAAIAEAIDAHPEGAFRRDDERLWQANSLRRGTHDLTIGHARAARAALAAVERG